MTSVTSTAVVATDRPQRYGKQLCSHLGRRSEATWDEADKAGHIRFTDGTLDLTSASDGLHLTLVTPPESVELLENVVGRHLVRFGAKDELEVVWQRSDGTAGTSYRNDGDDAGR